VRAVWPSGLGAENGAEGAEELRDERAGARLDFGIASPKPKVLTKDEGHRIAVNVARLPEPLGKQDGKRLTTSIDWPERGRWIGMKQHWRTGAH
jgi:hypothetical protein